MFHRRRNSLAVMTLVFLLSRLCFAIQRECQRPRGHCLVINAPMHFTSCVFYCRARCDSVRTLIYRQRMPLYTSRVSSAMIMAIELFVRFVIATRWRFQSPLISPHTFYAFLIRRIDSKTDTVIMCFIFDCVCRIIANDSFDFDYWRLLFLFVATNQKIQPFISIWKASFAVTPFNFSSVRDIIECTATRGYRI